MIEINLLPEELKIKKEKAAKAIKSRQVLYFIPLIFLVLIITHAYLISSLVVKSLQLRALNNKWQQLQPQKKKLEDFKGEYQTLSQDDNTIKQFTSQRIIWSAKLNKLSLNLPPGTWFREISVNGKNFALRGSVVSLQKEEMDLINKFIDNLKKDRDYINDFNNLELTSVQTKIIGGYDVTDFVLLGALK